MRGAFVWKVLLLAVCLLVVPAAAEEAEGWEPLALTLEHRAETSTTQCQIHLAHWFEAVLGPARPGVPAELPLLVRPASGEVALLNSVGDRMRLERIDCGTNESPRADWARLSIDPLRSGGGAATLACNGALQAHCLWLR